MGDINRVQVEFLLGSQESEGGFIRITVGAGKSDVGSRVIGKTGLESLKWADRELGDGFLGDE